MFFNEDPTAAKRWNHVADLSLWFGLVFVLVFDFFSPLLIICRKKGQARVDGKGG